MHEYKVEVTRDGRWWMIHVPEIDGLTQARRIGEIEDMARSLIAISTDTLLTEVGVRIASITVPGIGDIAGTAHHIEDLRHQAEELEVQVAAASKQYAQDLTRKGVPVRDAASLLGVSPQRISQIAKTG